MGVQEKMVTLVATSTNGTKSGTVAGLVCARPDDVGFCIGPLLADSTEVAEALLVAVQNALPLGTSLVIDVPEKNKAAVQLVKKLGMNFSFNCIRMYTKEVPKKPE